MATGLDAVAERIAPTRASTDYFNPAAGQSVMSRYANAGRRVADSELAAEAGSRLLQSRENRLASRRAQMKMDREDEEYEDYKSFKLERSKFLNDIGSINPEAEDFETRYSEIHKSLPAAAAQDPLVMDLLESKKRVADDLRNQRQMEDRDEKEFQRRLSIYNQRALADRRFDSLTPEEKQSFMLPDGTFDQFAAASLAYEKNRNNKKTDALDTTRGREEIKQEFRLEKAKDDELDDAQKKQREAAKQATIGDAEAFPDQVELVRQKLTKNGKAPDKKTLEKDPEYAAALDYEKNKFASEMESARKMSLDDYLAKGGKSEAAQEKRRMVWNAARSNGQADSAAPAAGKPLDREGAAALLKEAGGDKEKARQIARERGYSF